MVAILADLIHLLEIKMNSCVAIPKNCPRKRIKEQRKYFLTNRIIYMWNSLFEETVTARNTEVLKQKLDKEFGPLYVVLEIKKIQSFHRFTAYYSHNKTVKGLYNGNPK